MPIDPTFSTIQIKYSTSTQTPSSLAAGELAYSSASNKLFIGIVNPADANTTQVVEIGGEAYTSIINSLKGQIDSFKGSDSTIESAVIRVAKSVIADALNSGDGYDAIKSAIEAAVAAAGSVTDAAIADLQSQITAEVGARELAVTSEQNARVAAIEDLSSDLSAQITAEVTRASAAESALDGRLDAAETDIQELQDTDLQLGSDISALENRVSTIEDAVDISSTGGVTIEHLSVTGDLTVHGTVTTVNSEQTSISDPVIHLGADTSSLNDGYDRGVEFKWFDSEAGQVTSGFFGFDQNGKKFKFLKKYDENGNGDELGDAEFKGVSAKSLAINEKITISNNNITGDGETTLLGFKIHGGTF